MASMLYVITAVNIPAAVADTLLECLEIQGLNTFTTMVLVSDFIGLLNTTGSEVTVFAPTDEAFAEQIIEVTEALINAPGGTADELVGFHLVNGTVNFTKILTRMRYDNLAGSLLHGATVAQFTLNPGYSTNPYRNQPSPYGVSTEVSSDVVHQTTSRPLPTCIPTYLFTHPPTHLPTCLPIPTYSLPNYLY